MLATSFWEIKDACHVNEVCVPVTALIVYYSINTFYIIITGPYLLAQQVGGVYDQVTGVVGRQLPCFIGSHEQ